MRPIYLEMTAFGPYAHTESVDFSQFEAGCIFLVTGDTGSGKTSIFDALSFALYGVASGKTRETKSFHSDFCPLTKECSVTLRFSHEGKIYRIWRTPTYEVPKRDGSSTRPHPAKAEMECDDGRSWNSVQEVNQAVRDIIGLSAEQYAQVVMIAQGEFQKILFSKSEERRQLLSRLFGTEIYQKIQLKLKEKNAQALARVNGEKQAFSSACGRILEPSAELQRLAQSPERADEVAALLKAQIADETARHKRLSEEIGVLLEEQKLLRELLARAEAQNSGISRLNTAEEKKQSLDAQKAEMERMATVLEAAQRAEALEAAQRMLEREKNECTRLQAEQKAGLQALEELETKKIAAEAGLKTAEADRKRADECALEAENLKKLLPQFQAAQKSLDLLQAAKLRAQRAISAQMRLAEEYNRLHTLYLQDQAGILADALRMGEACPVCGSLEHPRPALHIEAAPDKARVDAAAKEMERANRAAESAAQESSALAAQLQTLLEGLGDCGVLKDASNLSECREVCRKRCDFLWAEADGLRRRIADAEAQSQKAQNAYSAAQARLYALEDELAKRKAGEEQAQRVCLQRMSELNFASEAEYLNARRSENERRRLQTTLEAWRQESRAVEAQLKDLTEMWGGKPVIEVEKLAAHEAEKRALLAQKDAGEHHLTSVIAQNSSALHALTACERSLQAAQRDFANINGLYLTASGRLGGVNKLPLENYILQYYYTRVIAAANLRLMRMSNRRFYLTSKMESSGNARTGLDLRVFDRETNRERETTSLSGGESFIASLSMALGFADVVQAESGNVRVDAMFIDEGFGSLDEDTLRRALNTLEMLAGGDRLVGVISHVAQLQDRIEPKIIVEKTMCGSKITLQT